MTIVYIAIGLVAGLALALIFLKKFGTNTDHLSDDFFNKFQQKFPELLNQANQSLVTMANQKLGAEKKEIETDLSNKKAAIEDLVKRVLDGLEKNQAKLETAEKLRVDNFSSLKQSLDDYKKITQDLSATTDGLKKVLSNNQLRGAFGEKIAEDLLKMTGFVKGIDYEFQKQNTDHSRPDFAVFLPDGSRINVDAKFPYSNLQKALETDDKSARQQHLQLFTTDVKNKIKQITSRDYIDPENKTVDFVILFIPNEMIFSYIYDKMPDVWEEGLKSKVVFAGPFSFTAILRMVRQAYDNFRYQKNTQAIISQIRLFEKEFIKYNLEFDKLGKRIDSLSSQYHQVSHTRTSKLLRVVDNIKLDNHDQEKIAIDS